MKRILWIKSCIMLMLVSLFTSYALAQQSRSVGGTVVENPTGEPIPGASILEKGTTNGTISDLDGNFSINLTTSNPIIVVSFIGFTTQEIPVGNSSTFSITLESDFGDLEEVVVVGYGTVKKSDLTGSVSSVKIDELNRGAITSVDQMLNGITGVNVVQNSGEPGTGFSINIRGASSVSGANNPLYVIDGVPIDNSPPIGSGSISGFSANRSPTNPLASINPQDIASIEILKDASAAAIYGSRGANGVILITTKRGKSGELNIEYQSSFGLQTVFNTLDILSATDYKRVLNEIIQDGGGNPDEIVDEIANGGIGTNWQEELTRVAPTQNHQLSFSGGTGKTTYYTSLNFTNQEGVVKFTDFNRYSMRVNLESQVTEKFKVGFNSTASYSENNYVPNGFSTNLDAGALYAAINFDPTLGISDEDGNFILSPTLTVDNPMALASGTSSTSNSNRIFTSFTGEYMVMPTLLAKVNIGGDLVNETRLNYISRKTINGQFGGGIGSNQHGQNKNYLVEGTLNYNKSINQHSITALGGISYQRFISSSANMTANDFPSDALGANNLSLGSQQTFRINNFTTGNRLASLIGRIDYNFMNKYSTTITMRRDGSSRFGENNKYGVFPSLALAWKISEEDFLKNSQVISFLKTRASYGVTGNQEIDNFAYQTTYSAGQGAIWDGQLVTSTSPTRLPNPDLKWEQTKQLNIGIDFGLFEDRIDGSIDYFRKETSDMLLDLPVPPSTGFNSVLTNAGQINNSGLEFFLNSKNITTSIFRWTTDFSISFLKNKVVDLGSIPEINSGSGFLHTPQVGIIRPGYPLNSFYGWQIDGVWQVGDDFSATKENVSPGDLKYVDQNGDGVVDGNDRVILGNSFPDRQWSFGNTITYKNLELFVFLEGVEGAQMLNGNMIDSYFPINFRRNKFAEPYLNRWTPENPSNQYPSFVDPLGQGRRTVNSITVQDASYVRLKNIRLSYNLPKSISWLKSGQIYVAAENLFMITDYDGIDPSINPNNNASLRVDFNSYPTARTFIFGFRISI
jgi:TonB-linked SusC/RagA family outer membrane protein